MKRKIITILLIFSIILGVISFGLQLKKHNKITNQLNDVKSKQAENQKQADEITTKIKKQTEEASLVKTKTINISELAKSIDLPEDWTVNIKIFADSRIFVIESPATQFIPIANDANGTNSKLVKFHLEIPLDENAKQYIIDNYVKQMKSKSQMIKFGDSYNFMIGRDTPLALINDRLTELPTNPDQLENKSFIFALVDDYQQDSQQLNGHNLVEENLNQYTYWVNLINAIKSYRNT